MPEPTKLQLTEEGIYQFKNTMITDNYTKCTSCISNRTEKIDLQNPHVICYHSDYLVVEPDSKNNSLNKL